MKRTFRAVIIDTLFAAALGLIFGLIFGAYF